MVYNKTKRGLEKAAGIVGVVGGALSIGGCLAMIIIGALTATIQVPRYIREYSSYYGGYRQVFDGYETVVSSAGIALLVMGIIMLAITICTIVFAAKIIKSPVTPNGVLNRKKWQILNIVFGFLTGNWIAAGLEIGAVCLKDFVPEKPAAPVARAGSQYIQVPNAAPSVAPAAPAAAAAPSMGLDQKVAELKKLKELGIIDDAAYKKAINKIVSEI